MYCENCGKKLEAGEICSCQKLPEKKKKKNKIRINIYMLISLFLFIFGVEMFLYFYIGAENFLELIPITFVKSNEWNFSCGILILIFSGGIISGILAIRDNTAKKASIIILVLNLVYLLAACGVLGKNIYQNYKTDNFVVNETTEDAAKIADSTLENEQKAVSETNAADENTEFIQTVLTQADELVQQGSIDKARNVLSDAYAVTKLKENLMNLMDRELQNRQRLYQEKHSVIRKIQEMNQKIRQRIQEYIGMISFCRMEPGKMHIVDAKSGVDI